MRDPDALWRAWREANAQGYPVTAKCHAEEILDLLRAAVTEPDWSAIEKARFLNWCDREGLLPRGRS